MFYTSTFSTADGMDLQSQLCLAEFHHLPLAMIDSFHMESI